MSRVGVVLPGQPLFQLPGSSAVLCTTSPPFQVLLPFSLSVPSIRGSTAHELSGRSKRNYPSISPGCLVCTRNSFLSGSNRGSSCPPGIRGQSLAMSVCQWPHLSPHAGPLTPVLSLIISQAEPEEVDSAKSQSWGPAPWAKREHVPAQSHAEDQGMGTCRKRLLLLSPSERNSEIGQSTDGLIWLQEAPA